jgi:hypothetical protein
MIRGNDSSFKIVDCDSGIDTKCTQIGFMG